MADFTVKVVKTQTVVEDYPVTAADETAATAAALVIAKEYVLQKNLGTFEYTVESVDAVV